MGYTIFFPMKNDEISANYSDKLIAEMNKTFTRAYRRELTELEKATKIPLNTIRDKFWSTNIDQMNDSIFGTYFVEDSGDGFFIERDAFVFIKTNRKLYDIAIKKGILAVQRKFNNPLQAWCDDGFIYNKNGITNTGEGLIDEYKPMKARKIKFSEMPITFKTKGGLMTTEGTYDWNR